MINKKVCIGVLPKGDDITVEINFDGKRLSIMGSIGRHECGQIITSFVEYDKRGSASINDIITLEGGRGKDSIKQFFDIWDKWHLNDMRAGCEHQRREKWGEKELIVNHYKLKPEVQRLRQSLENVSLDKLRNGESVQWSNSEIVVSRLPYTRTAPGESEYDKTMIAVEFNYVLERSEKKTAGWVMQEEHPEGVLCKACPICGYKYGSNWLFEEVPADVIAFLEAF